MRTHDSYKFMLPQQGRKQENKKRKYDRNSRNSWKQEYKDYYRF